MELKQIYDKTLDIFGVQNINDLSSTLLTVCRNNDTGKMQEFVDTVEDLSVDWLQKIFQYYEADRKEKKQDYTPKSLSEFLGRLVGDDTEIIDMCAGSGALTIQKWNQNHDNGGAMRAKDQLQELRRLDAEINNKIKERDELRQRSAGVRSFDYSKDRVVSSPSGDAMPDMVSKIITLEEQIKEMNDTLAIRRDEAYDMICRLDNKKEQDILFWRYIKGKSWRQVAVEMDISVRQAHYKHGDALAHLEDKI